MTRQLRKVIFLPACKKVLTDSGFVGPIYKKVKQYENYYASKWDKFWKRESTRCKEVTALDQGNENNLQGSIWKAIEYCQGFGYDIILYPEHSNELNSEETYRNFFQLKQKNLAFAMLEGNKQEDFLRAIDEYHINPHNSIFVARDYTFIEQLLEVNYHRNEYWSSCPANKEEIGFRYLYWNKAEHGEGVPLIKKNGYEELPWHLVHVSLMNNRIYSSYGFPFLQGKFFFIGDGDNNPVELFVMENLEWINKQARDKGCSFVYFQMLVKSPVNSTDIFDYIRYHYPEVDISEADQMNLISRILSGVELQALFLEMLNLPEFKQPALLRNLGEIQFRQDNEFSVFTFDAGKPVRDQFEFYFQNLQSAESAQRVFYQLKKKTGHDTVDERFDIDAQTLADDVIQKIEWLKQNGTHGLLAEIALRLFDGGPAAVLAELQKKKAKLEIKTDVTSLVSRLRVEWTSKFDFQIMLPDYGNMIVEMPRLPKALYYFFLQHPEGVMLNSLADYREELLHIYQRISNKSDEDEIAQNIDRLVDPLDNSINVNCSRIKNAFVKLIDDRLARNYYITGSRGKPKKVTLSPELIEITGAR